MYKARSPSQLSSSSFEVNAYVELSIFDNICRTHNLLLLNVVASIPKFYKLRTEDVVTLASFNMKNSSGLQSFSSQQHNIKVQARVHVGSATRACCDEKLCKEPTHQART
jgi:hypothetical protein